MAGHQHGERDPGLGAHERGQKLAPVGIGLVEVVGHRGEGPVGGPAGGGPDHLAPGWFVGRHDVSRRAWRTSRSRSSLEWRRLTGRSKSPTPTTVWPSEVRSSWMSRRATR